MNYSTNVFEYIIELRNSFIHKRYKAEKRVLANNLRLPRDLHNLILDYSRIFGVFVRDYKYYFHIHPRYMGGSRVKEISVNMSFIGEFFMKIPFGVCTTLTKDEFQLDAVGTNMTDKINLCMRPLEIFESFINMNIEKIIARWRDDEYVSNYLYKHPEFDKRLPDIADDIIQFLVWL